MSEEENYLQRLFKREAALAKEAGVEEAVEWAAKELSGYIDVEMIMAKASHLRYKVGTKRRNDVRAIMELLKAAVGQYGHEAVEEFEKNIIEVSDSKAIIRMPTPECPVLQACGGDLTLCESICRSHEFHGILTNPEFVQLAKEVNSKAKWKLSKFRESADGTCEYAVVIDAEGSG